MKVGDKVRVKRSIERPFYSWGNYVSHKSNGIITDIYNNGRNATVNFPEHFGWTALLCELELATSIHEEQLEV